tara:strand:+ start:2198 stop:3220 length:1023 start_codon:yes stop_codon:yes gene_type:complete
MKPQAYTEFQPLEEVLIGRNYDSKIVDSFDALPKVKSLLKRLLDETEEDFQHLIKVCETYGAKVIRPDYDYSKITNFSFPILNQPRDHNIVIGDKIVMGLAGDMEYLKSIAKCLRHYKEHFIIERSKLHGLRCPSIVRLGKDILADVGGKSVQEKHWDYLKNHFSEYNFKHNKLITNEITPMTGELHGDSIFAILKPGLIITEKKSHIYSELYPGWDIIEVDRNFNKMRGWNSGLKEKMMPYIYRFSNDEYHQEAFYQYINKWLTHWVGYSQETVWDINCLVLDEENVVFSQENKDLFKKLEKYKINPIVSPFRHRFFWDGGIHCVTLDIKRRGSCERYL